MSHVSLPQTPSFLYLVVIFLLLVELRIKERVHYFSEAVIFSLIIIRTQTCKWAMSRCRINAGNPTSGS